MTETEFWDLIDLANRSVSTKDELAAWLKSHLETLTVPAIVDFARHFRDANRAAYDERLWAAAITISDHFRSDDVFSDFCDWLVAQGKEVYTGALANPDSLSDSDCVKDATDIDRQGFSIASVAFEVYKAKTGMMDFSNVLGLLPPLELRNANTWDGQVETLPRIVPRLYERFRR